MILSKKKRTPANHLSVPAYPLQISPSREYYGCVLSYFCPQTVLTFGTTIIKHRRRCMLGEESDVLESQASRLERSFLVSLSRRRSVVNEETNWLHGELIACPVCHQPLYRVDHSPFYDEHFLYCDQCPIRVEVSFYDPVYQHLRQTLSVEEGERYAALMQALEVHLKPCNCGGIFRHDAPRRCFRCQTPVIIDTSDSVDLWPGHFSSEAPTGEEEENERHWMAQFIRTEDLWRDDS